MRQGNRVRHVAGGLFVALTVFCVASCTSTSKGSHDSTPIPSTSGSSSVSAPTSSSTKAVTPYCAKLRDAGTKIQQAEVTLYTSSNGKSSAVVALVAEINGLKAGAPTSVKAALTDLASAFTQAQSLLAHPSSANTSTLAQIGSKLATDAQRISQYVASKC